MKVKREKYTPSDIGPTPSDWEDPYLKDVSIFISNGFVGTATPFYTGSSGVAYLYGTNVRENNVDLKNTRYITKEFHNRQKKTELRTGDLVTVQSGHIGTTAVIPLELEGANCHALIITRLDASIMNPEFLSEYLNSEIGKARLRGLYVGSSILHINTKDLKRFRVPLPNVKEQEKIIHILNAWNKAIDLVELFIQNSEKKKKAILQLVFATHSFRCEQEKAVESGGFVATLGDIAQIKKGKGISKAQIVDSGQTKCVCYGELYTRYKEVAEDIFSSTDLPKKALEIGFSDDVLLPCSGETHIDIATATCIREDGVAYGGDITIIRSESIDGTFLSYYLNHVKKHAISRLAQGASVIHLYPAHLKKLEIRIPSRKEQEKIVRIVTCVEKEIRSFKQRRAFLVREKKALMQQLLTGKRRVNLDVSAEEAS